MRFLFTAAEQIALKVTREIKDVAVRAGESALFECHITGPLDVDVDWMSNGKLIQPALLNCKMHFDGKRCARVFALALKSSMNSRQIVFHSTGADSC